MITKQMTIAGMDGITYERMVSLARERGLRVGGQIAGTKNWLVRSGSEPGGFHVVTRDGCTCKAHEHRGYCSHRAWMLHRLSKKYGVGLAFEIGEEVAA